MKAVANLVLVAITSLIFSCSVESVDQTPDVQTSNSGPQVGLVKNRLAFTSLEHLFQVMSSEKKMDDVYKNATINSSFNSFYKKNVLARSETAPDPFQKDLLADGLPQIYYKVLNENGEVQVGDTLVWYNKGKIHFILNQDEEQLSRVKQDPGVSQLVGSYIVQTIRPANSKNARVTISNGGNARPEYVYNQQSPVAGLRRYIHELKAVTQTAMTVFHVTYLWINVRHEQMGGSGWEATSGESRHIDASVTGSYNLQNAGGYTNPAYTPNTPVSISNSLDTQTSSVDFTIGSYSTRGVDPPAWDVELNGSLIQQASGDPNQFSDTGYPLW